MILYPFYPHGLEGSGTNMKCYLSRADSHVLYTLQHGLVEM